MCQVIDSCRADLLRSEVLGNSTASHQQAAVRPQRLHSSASGLEQHSELPLRQPDSPVADIQPAQDGSQQALPKQAMPTSTAARSRLPAQAVPSAPTPTACDEGMPGQAAHSALPDTEATAPQDPAVTNSKKRKAATADVAADPDAENAAAADHVSTERAESAQQAGDAAAADKAAATKSGCDRRMKKQGTLQAAFAKAKVVQNLHLKPQH